MSYIGVCIGITALLLLGLIVFFGLNWLAALALGTIDPPQLHWPVLRAKSKRKREWTGMLGDDGELVERIDI